MRAMNAIFIQGMNYFHFLALVTRLSPTLSTITQYTLSSKLGGKRNSVLKLGSLCVAKCSHFDGTTRYLEPNLGDVFLINLFFVICY